MGWNCNLPNAVITRANTIEAWNDLVEPTVASFESGLVEIRDWIESTIPKLLELDGFGHAFEKAIAKANEVASARRWPL